MPSRSWPSRGGLVAERAELATLILDYLAAGEEHGAAFLFAADHSRYPVALRATSFVEL